MLFSRPFRRSSVRRRGFTVAELMIAMTIFGLAMAAVTRQLIESATLTLKTSRMLEYSRAGRTLIDQLNADLRNAQTMTLYSEFSTRTGQASGTFGNYLVLHRLNAAGDATRTIGYYALPNGSTDTHALYRHDSIDGVIAAGTLPSTGTAGTHRTYIGTLKLPPNTKFFRNQDGRGVSLRGQYGTTTGASTSTLNYIQCTLMTRS